MQDADITEIVNRKLASKPTNIVKTMYFFSSIYFTFDVLTHQEIRYASANLVMYKIKDPIYFLYQSFREKPKLRLGNKVEVNLSSVLLLGKQLIKKCQL